MASFSSPYCTPKAPPPGARRGVSAGARVKRCTEDVPARSPLGAVFSWVRVDVDFVSCTS